MKVRRLPLVDEYVEDGHSAVYVGDRVLVLSELATYALGLLCDQWSDVRRVADTLVDHFGSPPDDPDGVAATLSVLEQLAEEHLVELS